VRMTRLFLAALIVSWLAAAGMAVPREAAPQTGRRPCRSSTTARRSAATPKPDGVPDEVWENACQACTSMPTSPEASADGTLTSHSCDGGYEIRIKVVPGKTYPAGAKRDIMKGAAWAKRSRPTSRSTRSARSRR